MPDTPAVKGGEEKVGKGKKGLLTGKNKWYVVGGLGLLAVLVFFFVSRSNANAADTTTTTGAGGLDPSTQAALQGALQGQGSGIGVIGPAGPPGAAGAAGKRGKQGKQGKPGKRTLMHPPHTVPHKPPPHQRAGHTNFVTVRPGDSLSKIASQNNVSGGWEALYHKNRGVVGSNPNVIHPGQRLKI
jgi:nucleoid-associated protein YgaU